MEALDKIYLEKPKGCTGNLIGYAYKENKGLYDLSPVEYIRKDALLEWAEKYKHTYMSGDMVVALLIEKLQEL